MVKATIHNADTKNLATLKFYNDDLQEETVESLSDIKQADLDYESKDFISIGGNSSSILDVTKEGIKNDGTEIGPELNMLITKNYGTTMFFPDGEYNLTQTIDLPWRYDHNVNLVLSPNAVLKTEQSLGSILRIGFVDVDLTFDKSLRRFSYISGGQIDCTNVGVGIEINGLKQLVFIKDVNLFKGKDKHIYIHCSNHFKGTGSADTKISDVHIQGLSSNEKNYGIYIAEECMDCKISDVFIYGCNTSIYTLSGGHYITQCHFLSQVTDGGKDMGVDNFSDTVGIRIGCNATFYLDNVYFDTIDTCIYTGVNKPSLLINNSFVFSYLDSVGSSFFKRDRSLINSQELVVNNILFDIKKDNYKLINANIPVGYDTFMRTQFKNSILKNHNIYFFDPYLSQYIRDSNDDFLIRTDMQNFEDNWFVLGVMPNFAGELSLNISFSLNRSIKIYCGSGLSNFTYDIRDPKNGFHFQFGYGKVIVDNSVYYVLCMRTKEPATGFPVITTKSGSRCFMRTPNDDILYKPIDYGVSEEDIKIMVDI